MAKTVSWDGGALFLAFFSFRFFFVWPACLSDPCRMQSRAGRRKGELPLHPSGFD